MDNSAYKQQLMDRYHNLQFRGELTAASVDVAESNPLCGDVVRVQILLEQGKVTEAAWQGEGCAISQVAVDLLAEEISDMTVEQVMNLTLDDVKRLLGIELKPSREKCATLGLNCVRKGLEGIEGAIDNELR